MKIYRYLSLQLSIVFISIFILTLLFHFTDQTFALSPDFIISVDEIVVSGLDHPVQVTHAGDGSNRLFIVEQPGRIKIVQQDGVLSTTPFLDITTLVSYGGEQGLLGLAFHPSYGDTNGYFFVNYTRTGDGATVIARYQVSSNENIADSNSASILLVIPQPYTNHNGGQIAFGADGYLYIGMGDGGSGGDPQNYAQNINSLLGKLLRLDVDSGTPYAIPPDNPYLGVDGLDEIWALGLRNPWRFSFDSNTGDLYIGDVGQALWEEIDFQAANTEGGVNFGWRCREGAHTYSSTAPCNDPTFLATLTDPITEYDHSEGNSVSGGFVYNGSQFPSMQGIYFFADYVTGKIWSIKKLSSNPISWSSKILELDSNFNISAFGEDEMGELYVCDYFGGNIRHLVDASAPADLTLSKKYANTKWADPSETLTYTIELIKEQGSLIVPVVVTDTIPEGLLYSTGSLTATSGTVDDALLPHLVWSGELTTGITVTIQYQGMVSPTMKGNLINNAMIKVLNQDPFTINSTVFIPKPVISTTTQDFILPGTQPHGLNTSLVDSLDCDTCHSAQIYDKWRGSMMSQAGRDPLFWAALRVANNFVPNSGELCLRCHTSMGWFAGRSEDPEGNQLSSHDISNGISCQTCHRFVDPDPPLGSTDEASIIDSIIRSNLSSVSHLPPFGVVGSGMMVVDPEDRRRGPFSLGPTFSYHSAYQTNFLGQSSDAITRSRTCGTCHNVSNPILSYDDVLGEYWLNTEDQSINPSEIDQLFPVETTYDEWLESTYAKGGVLAPQFAGYKSDQTVEACQDCHLPRGIGAAADAAFNPFTRDCTITGCLPEHDFVGANAWIPKLLQQADWRLNAKHESVYLNPSLNITNQFLTKAASLDVDLIEEIGQKKAIITVTNETGHKLPTGYAEGRRMWINLKAYDAEDNTIQEYGFFDSATGALTKDTTVFEIEQALSNDFADYLGLTAGPSFHFMLNNSIHKDNRIPPRGFSTDALANPNLMPVGETYEPEQYWHRKEFDLPADTIRIKTTLYYQVASKDYIDFLKEYGGVDGNTLYSLWNTLPSNPQVVQVAWYPGLIFYFPIIMR